MLNSMPSIELEYWKAFYKQKAEFRQQDDLARKAKQGLAGLKERKR